MALQDCVEGTFNSLPKACLGFPCSWGAVQIFSRSLQLNLRLLDSLARIWDVASPDLCQYGFLCIDISTRSLT